MIVPKSFNFDLPVWRVLFDTFATPKTQNLLALELRNQTQVEWCVIDIETSYVIWQSTFPHSSWWTSLIGFYAGTLLFHVYGSNEQPAPKQLLGADAFSGKMRWLLDNCKFEGTDGRILKTSYIDATLVQKHHFLSLTDGSHINTHTLDSIIPCTQWMSPVHHSEQSPYFSLLRQFIESKTHIKPEKAIKYGEISNRILFFQYLYPTNAITLSHSILVVNSSKVVLWHEIIDSSMNTKRFDACVYNDHYIVYLKNSSELVVLNLPLP